MHANKLFAFACAVGAAFCFHAKAEPTSTDGGKCGVSRGKQANDALRALSVPPDGRLVFAPGGAGFVDRDGALGIKFAWERLIAGSLIVGGRRLDGDAAPARAYMNHGYGNIGFQPTYLVFPTPGCWEITGRSLTFVVHVEKIGNGPDWHYEGLPERRLLVPDDNLKSKPGAGGSAATRLSGDI